MAYYIFHCCLIGLLLWNAPWIFFAITTVSLSILIYLGIIVLEKLKDLPDPSIFCAQCYLSFIQNDFQFCMYWGFCFHERTPHPGGCGSECNIVLTAWLAASRFCPPSVHLPARFSTSSTASYLCLLSSSWFSLFLLSLTGFFILHSRWMLSCLVVPHIVWNNWWII